MKNLKYILVLGCLFVALTATAQSQSSMRLNEILLHNTTDFQDDFGQHNAWIELFNESYGTVDIGGCYLTNDPNNLKKYIIPKGDVITKIKPRQHTLFWADNNPYHGTFHTNFTIEAGQEILFVSSDGRTVVDRIVVPEMGENESFGRLKDGEGAIDGSQQGWHITNWTSPSTNNSGVDEESKSEKMRETDPYGWILSITAMSVVFLALIILAMLFKLTGRISIKNANKKTAKTVSITGKEIQIDATDIAGETYAAIAMALHLYNEQNSSHDEESLVVTMAHTDRSYSPWSSKIYTLRQTPIVNKNKK
ncbi:MAG: OadG family transporter subunit [Bacteroidales bacterium]|nr:OadG family transporter subunit [Bacteroidales bacterium]MDD3200733.1 OadG family transporter subunit [Bacteroidales bacterium]